MTEGRVLGRLALGLATLGFGVAGCGGGGSAIVVRPPTTPGTSASSPSPTTSARIDPHVTVHPSRHLADGQLVHVEARGFGPNQSLITIECVDIGKRTGQGSCDVANLSGISIGPAGTGSASFTVRRGPLGSDHLSCTHRHPCIVSVSQATIDPSQTASAQISFD